MKPDFEKLGLELSNRVDKEYSVWNGQTCISLRGIEKLSQALQSAYELGRSDERERYGWQPIETAPKDGTMIIAAYFYEEGNHPYNLFRTEWVNDQWFYSTSSMNAVWSPTHWMPIPQMARNLGDSSE